MTKANCSRDRKTGSKSMVAGSRLGGFASSSPSAASQDFLDDSDDALRLEPELLLQRFQRRRRAERLHADGLPARSDVPLPAERGGLFDGDASRDLRREHT